MKVNTEFTTIHQQPAKAPDARDMLESAFLSEMLKFVQINKEQGEFSGGAGEAHFSSFLTDEYAALLAGRLDLGLPVSGHGG